MLTAKDILLQLMTQSSLEHSVFNIDEEQAYCLALNVYHEARSESVEGQFAVAHTTLNRVKDDKFPNTVCGVVQQSVKDSKNPNMPLRNKCQFSWYCDGKSDKVYISRDGNLIEDNIDAFEVASLISLTALMGLSKDNTNGSTHYYNYNLSNPSWGKVFTTTAVIGNHKFLRRDSDT